VAYDELVGFLSELADAAFGKKLSHDIQLSAPAVRLNAAFVEMGRWVDEIPPIEQPMRFGNKAFKDWYARMCKYAPELIADLLDGNSMAGTEAEAELTTYFIDSMGNSTRIDYGTGHELALFVFLKCLRNLGIFSSDDSSAIVLSVFQHYLQLVRLLQTTYLLEPAGSHGVWGLDDYQFLPFFFGAAQLADQSEIRPHSIHDEEVLEEWHTEYLYLAAVRFVRHMKKGPFWEHSPYLNDISNLDSWQRVASGLLKMYRGEVLGKLPVVQHLKFGRLLPWDSKFND